METIAKSFSGSRDEVFAKVIRYIDQNLDFWLRDIPTHTRKYILIDLGNIHDAHKLSHLLSTYNVVGFADVHYNGPGVHPRQPSPFQIIRARTVCKNAADVHIIWYVYEIIRLNAKSEINIITRDKGFQELIELGRLQSTIIKFHNSSQSFLQHL